MNSGSRSAVAWLWSMNAAVAPPRSTVTPASGRTSSRRCSIRSSVAGSCGDVRGVTVSTTAPPAAGHRLAHAGDARLVAQRAGERRHRIAVALVRRVGREQQRAVGAGAEALRDEVIGLARRRVGRVVAAVREAEPQPGERRREDEQHRHARDRGDERAALHGAAPARRGRAVGVAGGAVHARDPQPVDPRPGHRHQRRDERHRRRHHDEDREDRGERGAVEVGQAHQEQAEQRDHDGGAGDQHRAAGGRDRLARPLRAARARPRAPPR